MQQNKLIIHTTDFKHCQLTCLFLNLANSCLLHILINLCLLDQYAEVFECSVRLVSHKYANGVLRR